MTDRQHKDHKKLQSCPPTRMEIYQQSLQYIKRNQIEELEKINKYDFSKALYKRDENGNTLLHHCARINSFGGAEYILKFEGKFFFNRSQLQSKSESCSNLLAEVSKNLEQIKPTTLTKNNTVAGDLENEDSDEFSIPVTPRPATLMKAPTLQKRSDLFRPNKIKKRFTENNFLKAIKTMKQEDADDLSKTKEAECYKRPKSLKDCLQVLSKSCYYAASFSRNKMNNNQNNTANHGKGLIVIENNDGKLPIHLAASFHGKKDFSRIRSRDHSKNASPRDSKIATGLGFRQSCLQKQIEVTENDKTSVLPLLLEWDVRSNGRACFVTLAHKDSIYGLTPFQECISRRNDIAADLFLSKIEQVVKNIDKEIKEQFTENGKSYTVFLEKNTMGKVAATSYLILKTMKSLLNETDRLGQNAVHYASYYNCPKTLAKILKILSDYHLDKTIMFKPDDNRQLPIHLASSEGNTECCKILLNFINNQSSTPHGNLACNINLNDRPIADKKFSTHENELLETESDGSLPIHKAIESNNLSTVKLLLEHSVRPEIYVNSVETEYGNTPIILAAGVSLEICQLLLEPKYSADLSIKNHLGNNCFHIAAINNEFKILEFLLSKISADKDKCFDINDFNFDQKTAFQLAAKHGHIETVKILLKYAVDKSPTLSKSIEVKDFSPPLDWAELKEVSSQGSSFNEEKDSPFLALQNKICCRANLSVTTVDSKIQNVLHLIASNISSEDLVLNQRLIEIVKLIFGSFEKAYGQIQEHLFTEDENNYTPLHIASEKGAFNLAEIFIKTGHKVDIKNDLDRTPLMLACINNHLELIKFYCQNYKNTVMDVDIDQNTSLHLACMLGHLKAAKELVKVNSSNVKALNHVDATPLDLAAKNGFHEVCKFLLQSGAELDPKNKSSKTPLMLAAENGHYKTVQFLINAGAKPYAVTAVRSTWVKNEETNRLQKVFEGGLNSLELAIQNNHYKCCKIILLSKVWDESLRNARYNSEGILITPMRSLLKTFPNLAVIVLNRSINVLQNQDNTSRIKSENMNGTNTSTIMKGSSQNVKIQLNFEFIEDLYRISYWKACSGVEAGFQPKINRRESLSDSNLGYKKKTTSLKLNTFKNVATSIKNVQKLDRIMKMSVKKTEVPRGALMKRRPSLLAPLGCFKSELPLPKSPTSVLGAKLDFSRAKRLAKLSSESSESLIQKPDETISDRIRNFSGSSISSVTSTLSNISSIFTSKSDTNSDQDTILNRLSQRISKNTFRNLNETMTNNFKDVVGKNYTRSGILKTDAVVFQWKKYSRKDEASKEEEEIYTPSDLELIDQHILSYIIESNEISLLKHPLVLKLLEEKWKAYGQGCNGGPTC